MNKTKTQEKYEKNMLACKEKGQQYTWISFDRGLELLKEQEEELNRKHSEDTAYDLFEKSLSDQKKHEVSALQEQSRKFEEVLTNHFESNIYFRLNNGQLESCNMGILDELLKALNQNANLNVQVAEHQTGATKSAQVGSSKLKDKTPSSTSNEDTIKGNPLHTKESLNSQTIEDRGSNLMATKDRNKTNLCECGHRRFKHWNDNLECLSSRVYPTGKNIMTPCRCKKFHPKKEVKE